MTNDQLDIIFKRLAFNTPLNLPTRVYGGLVHKMWRVESEDQTFAIKELNKNINFTESVQKKFNLTEEIAHQFAQKGIPAIGAIKTDSSYLIETKAGQFLVYPWVNAHAVEADAVSEKQALKIAKILAAIHSINLDAPGLNEASFNTCTTDKFLSLIDKAEASKCSFANDLRTYQTELVEVNELYHSALSLLEQDIIISHGDLDPKNVLWDEYNNPLIIDWEASRKINPTYDIITAGLDWSGIANDTFNEQLFKRMISTYIISGGHIDTNLVQAAFYGVLGWINWMIYNIERAYSATEQEQIILSEEQVIRTLKTIIKLKKRIPDLVQMTENEIKHSSIARLM